MYQEGAVTGNEKEVRISQGACILGASARTSKLEAKVGVERSADEGARGGATA